LSWCVNGPKLEWRAAIHFLRAFRRRSAHAQCDNVFMIKRSAAAELVRRARRSAGLTQRGLARRSKIPQPTIAAIEAGRQDPRFETVRFLVESCDREVSAMPRLGQGVDRTQIRELLRLSPGRRLRSAAEDARGLERLLRSTKR
jgi:transcriptional regulator with XRE-family HTH domain